MHESDNPSWFDGLTRATFYACAFWVGLQVLPAAMAIGAGPGPRAALLLSLALLCQLSLCILLATAGRLSRPPRGLPGMLLGWTGLVIATPISWVNDPGLNADVRLTVPVAAVQALQIWALVTEARFRAAFLTIMATGPAYLLLVRGLSWSAVETWLIPTIASTTLAALLAFLRSGSRYATELEDRDRQVRQETAAATALATAQAAARRVIHDDVISALRAVGSDPQPPGTARACADALDALDTSRTFATQEEIVSALREATWLDLTVDSDAWPATPAHVLEAIHGAAAEALRNVERHAGVAAAHVRLSNEEGRACLEVTDDGAGLSNGAVAGFGIRSSIEERMAAVGGAASIGAGPRGGTRVRLSWAPPAPLDRGNVTPYTAVGTRRGYLSVALPVVLGNSFLAWRYPGESAAATIGIAVTCAALVVLTAIRFAHHPPKPVASLGVTLTVTALTALGLANVTTGGVVDYRGWAIGFAADLTMFLAFHLSVRHIVLPVLAQTSVIASFAWADPTVAVPDAFGALITPVSIGGVACVIGSVLRRTACEVHRAEGLLAARIEERAWQVSAAEVRRVHLAALRRELSPFLRTAAERPPGAELSMQASVLAARCRDQLHLSAPLPDRIQAVVDEARRRGCTVSFRVGDEPVTWSEQSLDVLERVLTEARPQIVTLVPGPTAQVTCLPPLPPRVRARLAEYDVADDPVRTVIRLSSDQTSSRPDPCGPIPVG